jgi:hypothetical protein
MSGKEIAGLQALAMAHGGSLTINPKTGLPEAGFLDNLLPTIVGAGIGYFTGNPMLAASIMGGGTFLNTGDLGKGLMAGLGGYGAGSLGSGFAGIGQSALGAEAANASIAAGATPEVTQAAVADKLANASIGEKFGAAASNFGKPGTVEALGGLGKIGMAAAPMLGGMLGGKKALATAPGTEQMIRPYTFAANPQELAQQEKMIGSKYEPGQDTSERTWFKPEYTALPAYKAAEGGLMQEPVVRMAQGGLSSLTGMYTGDDVMSMGTNEDEEEKRMAKGGLMGDQPPMRAMLNWINPETMPGMSPEMFKTVDSWKDKYFPLQSETPKQQAADLRFDRESGTYFDSNTGQPVTQMARGGGISDLGSYSDGGRLLKGPGDGMSDNIPAQIGAKQPARLADGEFVVPADVVSHLGNGSTDAGAKQLYKMMDRIRQQRTGKKKQAPEVRPSKAMPA